MLAWRADMLARKREPQEKVVLPPLQELTSVEFTYRVERQVQPHNVVARASNGLCLELDLLRSTGGSVQRVSYCCGRLAYGVGESSICTACRAVVGHTSDLVRIATREGEPAESLGERALEWARSLGYPCLEAGLFALALQEHLHSLYGAVQRAVKESRWDAYVLESQFPFCDLVEPLLFSHCHLFARDKC